MHEGAVMQETVTTILASLEHTGATRVSRVHLALGTSEHFTEEAVRQYFLLLTEGTLLEGATLLLSWLPATYQCLSCQQRFESTATPGICPCCGDVALEIAHQDACRVQAIEAFSPFEADRSQEYSPRGETA